jgi:S1-C subfamily serine protease
MTWLRYLYLSLFTVTLHISVLQPSPKNPHQYSIDTCSGVFISPNEILTANHCIAESRGHQWIRTYEGISLPVRIEKHDKYKDLALLVIDKSDYRHVYIRLGKPVHITDFVCTVNSGGDYKGNYSQGIVSNIVDDMEYGASSILHTSLFMSGASGSGLFNSKCQLVGINVAYVYGMPEAVDIKEIESFLGRK